MIGANLPDLDEWTFKLLTNAKVLEMVSDEQLSTQTPVQIMKDDNQAVWYSYKEGVGCPYVALFNLSEEDREVSVELNSVAGLADFDFDSVKEIEELWTGDKYDLAQFQSSGGKITDNIRAHAAKLYRLGWFWLYSGLQKWEPSMNNKRSVGFMYTRRPFLKHIMK